MMKKYFSLVFLTLFECLLISSCTVMQVEGPSPKKENPFISEDSKSWKFYHKYYSENDNIENPSHIIGSSSIISDENTHEKKINLGIFHRRTEKTFEEKNLSWKFG